MYLKSNITGQYLDEITARQRRALDIKTGQVFRLNGRKYTVFEVYPYFIRLRSGEEEITLNKGDLIVMRSGERKEND